MAYRSRSQTPGEHPLTAKTTPQLREYAVPAQKLIAVAKVSTDAAIAEEGEGQLSKILDTEAWEVLPIEAFQTKWDSGKGITCEPENGGLALLFDLGEEMSGQTEFTIEAASGTVDHYGAELLRDGRPWANRGNAEYAARWTASGRNPHFRTLNYNGFRYLLIVLRPNNAPMLLKEFGVWRREANITPVFDYQSENPELQRMWDVSMRTLQVSTQETCVDCPTREQALFIADGLWNALWIDKLYDEPSYFEHYLDVIAKAQNTNGLMPSSVFSSLNPPHYLLDFCLIFVWGVDVYHRAHPERTDIIQKMLPVAERTLRWYQDHIGPSGLIETDPLGIENYEGGRFEVVFIDHPSIWHTFSHPGIERSRKQLGLNAYLAIAIDAFTACAQSIDYTHTLDTSLLHAHEIRGICHTLFFNEKTGYYADCIDTESGELKGWSAQSQILAVLGGVAKGDAARQLMGQLIQDWQHPEICRCTPYFWTYFAEALIVTGYSDKIMPLIRKAWSIMTEDPDTTTWWETFEGSDRNTRCHPWAALPAWFLMPEGRDFRLCGNPSKRKQIK
ncbi:family 78 glycoside hydrolase catalytic domain [Coraliomargarita algicola]|uniref:Family 78 glycoside hydrolase catalytic domain n=1 Tax=Coraliomargarita algicola TaxID=3092156 RepID=A0ABZ0RL87_9BACT|nr:family 78 glycoside hydrolase catalytic domain [Coraliomargarita sp. J2-16]WPJ95848.1 family 78 glycoside hydrolase catalytic domain [Coraliomargarita sp. J2-16]